MGDCGRPPLMITLLKQVVGYINRVKNYEINKDDRLLLHASAEQRKLQLPCYTTMRALLDKVDPNTPENILNSSSFSLI